MNKTQPIDVAAGATILNDLGEILLIKRSETAAVSPGEWTRPLGSVEFGEESTTAIAREVLEETDVVIELESRQPYHVAEFIHPDETPPRHVILLEFRARWVSGEAKNMEPKKHDEVRWFKLDELPEKLSFNTKKAIASLRKT